MKPVLLDTGVIVALLDRSERTHGICAEIIAGLSSPLVTCEAVIAESCYLLRGILGAAEAVVENVESGVFQIPFRLAEAPATIRRFLHKYRDRCPALADACLVYLAGELGTGSIATLDSDFDVYRWGKSKSFHNVIRLGPAS